MAHKPVLRAKTYVGRSLCASVLVCGAVLASASALAQTAAPTPAPPPTPVAFEEALLNAANIAVLEGEPARRARPRAARDRSAHRRLHRRAIDRHPVHGAAHRRSGQEELWPLRGHALLVRGDRQAAGRAHRHLHRHQQCRRRRRPARCLPHLPGARRPQGKQDHLQGRNASAAARHRHHADGLLRRQPCLRQRPGDRGLHQELPGLQAGRAPSIVPMATASASPSTSTTAFRPTTPGNTRKHSTTTSAPSAAPAASNCASTTASTSPTGSSTAAKRPGTPSTAWSTTASTPSACR